MGEEVDIAELSDAASRFTGDAVSREDLVEVLGHGQGPRPARREPGRDGSARFPHALARQAVVETLTDVDLCTPMPRSP